MAHDPASGNPITIKSGPLQVELPIRGLKTSMATKLNHLGFAGLTDGDRITKIVVKNGSGEVVEEFTSGVEGWSVEVFFEHPH